MWQLEKKKSAIVLDNGTNCERRRNGLDPSAYVASLAIPSWNQILGFLESMRRLREASSFAA